MKTLPSVLFALALSATAQALTLQGTVAGGADLGTSPRLGLWQLNASGNTVGNELTSTSITGGKFSLNLPSGAPSSQYALRPDSIGWPGVVGDVQVDPSVQASDVAFFVYADSNGNGTRDSSEPLRDAFPDVQRQPVFVVWAAAPSKISAGKGYSVALGSGWNAFTVEMGKAATVSPYKGQPINLRVQ